MSKGGKYKIIYNTFLTFSDALALLAAGCFFHRRKTGYVFACGLAVGHIFGLVEKGGRLQKSNKIK